GGSPERTEEPGGGADGRRDSRKADRDPSDFMEVDECEWAGHPVAERVDDQSGLEGMHGSRKPRSQRANISPSFCNHGYNSSHGCSRIASALEWVLFAYRIPREPSAPRIAIWRKLRRLGALQLGDGLVTLPRTPQNQERLEWLADEIGEAGGQASLWF